MWAVLVKWAGAALVKWVAVTSWWKWAALVKWVALVEHQLHCQITCVSTCTHARTHDAWTRKQRFHFLSRTHSHILSRAHTLTYLSPTLGDAKGSAGGFKGTCLYLIVAALLQ